MKISIIEMVGGHGGMNGLNHPLILSISKHENAILYTAFHGFKSDNVRNWFDISYKYNNKIVKGIINISINIYIIILSLIKGTQIFHLHFYQYGVLQATLISLYKLTFKKVVISTHDAESFSKFEKDKFKKYVISRADTILAHSSFSYNQMINFSKENKLNADIKMVNLGPPTSGIEIGDVVAAKSKLGLDKDTFTLLFFGQIKDVKGLDIILNAIPKIGIKNLKLIIAGRPWHTDFQEFQNLIDKNNLKEKVISHIRYIADEEVSDFFNSADVVCLPYRRIYQSGVLLYALCYNKVVLCSDLEPFKEIVVDKVNGFIFKSGSVDDFATKVTEIYNLDETQLHEIERARKNMLNEKFNWDKLALKTINIYKNLL